MGTAVPCRSFRVTQTLLGSTGRHGPVQRMAQSVHMAQGQGGHAMHKATPPMMQRRRGLNELM